MSTADHNPLKADALPLPSASDRARDESAPAFLARLRAEYGDLGALGDVLAALGIEAA